MRFRLASHAQEGVLLGKEHGEQLRHMLERNLASIGDDDPITVDISDVRAVSVTFVDSFLGPLLTGRLGGYYEDHPFFLIGATEDVADTIAAALRLRGLTVLSLGDGEPRLLGGEPALAETIRVANEIREFSATEIADKLGVTTQAANNRLKALLRSGALSRIQVTPGRGGREFRYRVPLAPGR